MLIIKSVFIRSQTHMSCSDFSVFLISVYMGLCVCVCVCIYNRVGNDGCLASGWLQKSWTKPILVLFFKACVFPSVAHWTEQFKCMSSYVSWPLTPSHALGHRGEDDAPYLRCLGSNRRNREGHEQFAGKQNKQDRPV